jgi:hypothetical protein
MADFDALLNLQSPPNDDARGAVRAEIEQLLSPANSALWTALTTFIQSAPEVAAAYARVRQILSSLPKPPANDDAAKLYARDRWAEMGRKRT